MSATGVTPLSHQAFSIPNALVVASHGRHVWVEDGSGKRILCHPRGKKNITVVGDYCQIALLGDEGVIERVVSRKNLLYRQDEWKTKAFASNLDQILYVIAAEPDFSESQLTRTLIAAADQKIPVTLMLNKIDLKEKTEKALDRIQKYKNICELILKISAIEGSENTELYEVLKSKKTLIMGPSGVGKSTLINRLVPSARAWTQEISTALASGKHTTTSSTLYWMGDGETAIIDSPGFQEFGLKQIAPSELINLMPDLKEKVKVCKFYNCTHTHEPGCSLLAYLDGNTDDSLVFRHQMYKQILDEISIKSNR